MKKTSISSLLLILFTLFVAIGIDAKDFTFFLTSDPHYGYQQWDDNERANKEAIADMNQLPGTPYRYGSEVVSTPLGVVVPGDLTSQGHAVNWSGFPNGKEWVSGFDQDYEVNGNGLLRYPVYEGYGNHDIHSGNYAVLVGIYYRNKVRSTPVNVSSEGLHYSWDWENVHLVQLNIFPGGDGDAQNSLDFLKEDLAKRIGNSGKPVILFQHYDFYSDPKRWFHEEDKNRFYEVIKNYNIVGIFVGHTHSTQFYYWHNIPVFNAPTVKENKNYFVVRVRSNQIIVDERKNGAWAYTFIYNFK